jgi:flagellar motor switch protein FliM
MSDAQSTVLTREELDAIFATVAAGSADDARSRRGAGATDAASFAWSPLARALRQFGEESGRSLSTLFQRTITFSLIDLRSLPADDFAAAMLATDAPVQLRFEPSGLCGAMLIGRTLVYGWLTLCFGGEVDASPLHVPARRYSRIELKQLRGAVVEFAERLARSLAPVTETEIAAGPIAESDLIASEIAPRLWVGSFEATGLGELARLRVALPDALFARAREVARPAAKGQSAIGERLHEMPVLVRAEVGSAELTLRRVRDLRVGDVVALQPASADSVLIRVEGEPKFRAARGQVGARLAVRITERL